MTSTDQYTGISTVVTYSQDTTQLTQGMPIASTTTMRDGTVINQQISTLDTRIFGTQEPNATWYFPYVKSTVEKAYDLQGNLLNTKRTSNVFTSISTENVAENPLEIDESNEDASGASYEISTKNTYQDFTDHGQWILGELMSSDVQATAPSYTGNRHTAFTYDAKGFLTSSSSRDVLTKQYTRDIFGNVIQTDISGTETSTGVVLEPRSEKVTYDALGRFIIGKTNALNQSTSYQVDPRFGAITQTTDPNGLVETNILDGFGRVMSTTHPDNTQTNIAYQWSVNDPNAPQGSVYEIMVTQTGSPEKISYHDELDREIGQAMQGFGGK